MPDELKDVAEAFFSASMDKLADGGKKALQLLTDEVKIRMKTGYKDYLSKSYEKFSKAKSFFTQNQAVNLYDYYIPSGIIFNNAGIDALTLSDAIEISSKCIISGTAGSGKSILLRHLFLDSVKSKKYVPIMLELRDFDEADLNLTNFILRTLSNFGLELEPDLFNKLLAAEHFAFLFDGYDELSQKYRKKVIRDLKSLSNKSGASPIILSTRPDESLHELNDFSVLPIAPLTLAKSVTLVEKLPIDDDVKKKFSQALKDELFEKHESFLSNPLLLTIMLLTYGDWAEVPSNLSRFYDQAYHALFQRHDANKGAFSRERKTKLDSQQYSSIFSYFALLTYSKNQINFTREQCLMQLQSSIGQTSLQVSADDFLDDSLKAVCLLLEEGLDITFAHRSFQEYFVAKFISHTSPDEQLELISKFSKRIRGDNVMSLLFEINQGLVERNFVIPNLKNFFERIKATKKLTRTSLIRALKILFTEIKVKPDGSLVFSTSRFHELFSQDVLAFVVKSYKFDIYQSDAIKENRQSKYITGDNDYIISLKDEGYRSKKLNDFLDLPGNWMEAWLDLSLNLKLKLETQEKSKLNNLNSFLN